MTTMSALQNEPTSQVKRLMGGKDAVDVAFFAHKVNKKYPWTTELHFQRQSSWKCGPPVDLSKCPENKCLVKALKHLYGRLVNKPIVDIDWGAGIKLTDADALKYLINLIADLHQPLHLGFDDDGDMGRKIKVNFRGRDMSLYDLWDKELTQAIMKDSPGFWWGGWTHVSRTRTEYEKDAEQWKKDGVNMFDQWAADSLKFACDDVYKNPVTGIPIDEEAKKQGGTLRVDNRLFETWKRELLSKILVAGARTAIVVNSILAQREVADHLHSGSGVAEIEGEEDDIAKAEAVARRNGHKHDPSHKHVEGIAALGANALIFVIVLVIFIYTMRIWQGTAVIDEAQKAKQTNAAGGKKT
jgi:hypothetical protein